VTAWKDLERRVCRALGGERSGPLGKGTSDCSNVPFSVEVKRSSRPGPPVLSKWILQAREHARKEKRPWLVVVAAHGTKSPIVALDFNEFLDLARRAGVVPEQEGDEDASV
jgi:hypothetical protein